MDFSDRFIGLDFLQERYYSSTFPLSDLSRDAPEGSISHHFLPSILLPLFHGEGPMAGFEALTHRRARGWEWPSESRMLWGDNEERGCGRVPLAAAMQQSIESHRSWGRRNEKGQKSAQFSWRPYDRCHTARPIDIVASAIQKMAGSAQDIALAIPDTSDEGVVQALCNSFSSLHGSRSCRLHLIRRSIAQAMIWCRTNSDRVRADIAPLPGHFAGHLIALNFAMDFWEARLVPLQWYLHEKKCSLLPVDSERWPHQSFGISGWEAASRLLFSTLDLDSPSSLWNKLLEPTKAITPSERPFFTQNEWDKIARATIPPLPHCDSLMAREIPSFLEMKLKLNEIAPAALQIDRQAKKCLGVIADGFFTSSLDINALLPPSLRYPPLFTVCSSTPTRRSLAADGAALYAHQLRQGFPPFLQEIAPVEIWCRNTSRYGSEFIWKPLIDNETLVAGSEKREKRCTGFVLGAGCEALTLTLRRPSYNAKEFEYRTIKAKMNEIFTKSIDLLIDIEVRSGGGYAKAYIAAEDGHLLSLLDWAGMLPTDKPVEHHSGHLARACEAKSDRNKWQAVVEVCRGVKIESLINRGIKSEKLREAVGKLLVAFSTNRVKQDKNDLYSEWRAISSEGTVSDHHELLTTLSLFLELSHQRALNREDKALKKSALQVMQHLFCAISPSSRELLSKKLLRLDPLSTQELLCIGFSFTTDEEVITFLQALIKVLASEENRDYFWLQALGYILRYRYQIVDPMLVPDELYETVWQAVVDKLKLFTGVNNNPRKAISAVRCLIYLLGRRRFDKNFLTYGSQHNDRLRELLNGIRDSNSNKTILKLTEQLQMLLACRASEEDIQLLLCSEYNHLD